MPKYGITPLKDCFCKREVKSNKNHCRYFAIIGVKDKERLAKIFYFSFLSMRNVVMFRSEPTFGT